MKKGVRGLVKNNKGNSVYKRVDKIEFNHEDKIEKVEENYRCAVFEFKIGKNEMARFEVSKWNGDVNTLNNIMNGKDKKTYVLTCKDEPCLGKNDSNKVKNIKPKEETNSPICNKAIEGIGKGYGDLGNNCDRLIEKRIDLDISKEEKEKEIQCDKEILEKKEEEIKMIEIELDEAKNNNDKDEAHRLLDEYFEKVEGIEEFKKSITEKKNQINNISTKMGILTKKIQRIQRLIDEANSVALSH